MVKQIAQILLVRDRVGRGERTTRAWSLALFDFLHQVRDLSAARDAEGPCRCWPAGRLPGQPALGAPGLAELDQRALRLPRVWPLIVTTCRHRPDLFAGSGRPAPGLDASRASLGATPDDQVRAGLRRVFGGGQWPDSATDLFERPRETLAEIAAQAGGLP